MCDHSREELTVWAVAQRHGRRFECSGDGRVLRELLQLLRLLDQQRSIEAETDQQVDNQQGKE